MEKVLRNTLIFSGLLGGVSVDGYFLYRSILKPIDLRYESDSSSRLESKLLIKENNAFSTAVDNTLDITATFAQASGSIYTQLFNLYKIF